LGLFWACNDEQGPGPLFPGSSQKDRFGSIGGPSIVSACSRCGWSLGHVQDRYLRYDGNAMSHMFPNLKSVIQLQGLLSLCLASLAFHSQTLLQTLPKSHPIFHTYIFREQKIMTKLQQLISVNDSMLISESGTPPHVELYKQQQLTQETVAKIQGVVLEGMANLIEEKGVSAGNITIHQLRSTMREMLNDFTQYSRSDGHSETKEIQHNDQVYHWGGRLDVQPKSLEFPSVDVFQAWKL
jgi:hypothetical protein